MNATSPHWRKVSFSSGNGLMLWGCWCPVSTRPGHQQACYQLNIPLIFRAPAGGIKRHNINTQHCNKLAASGYIRRQSVALFHKSKSWWLSLLTHICWWRLWYIMICMAWLIFQYIIWNWSLLWWQQFSFPLTSAYPNDVEKAYLPSLVSDLNDARFTYFENVWITIWFE